jgi:5-deoxy-D-glucuronate isomerase
MTPPEAAGDYKDIQKVIEKNVKNGIILKAPNEGMFSTAITFSDFNGDNENDAVAFYRVKNDELVEFPYGYHAAVATPGYTTYFLWLMAGDYQGFNRSSDPEHAWIEKR